MKISYNWLKNYVKDLPSPETVADTFTFHICELEESEKLPNGDTIFDIKVLPDRAHDLLSHKGVAKDLAGVLGLSFNDIKYKKVEGELTNLKIKIETEKCRRYMGRIMRNIKVEPSPEWVRNYLESLGQRSINNIVDATNIVMFDLGQPIHAFDLDKLYSPEIIIRQAKAGEMLTTLDGKELKLNPENMVIADSSEALVVAGVKGGKKAEIDTETKNIMIEVANFDPTSVRKTAKAINIYTDAVKRFENDLSPEIAEDAMNEITALVLEMCGDAKVEAIVDEYKEKIENRKIKFNLSKISKILGMAISEENARRALDQFSYVYSQVGDTFEMEVPFNRPDFSIPEDMAEEIGRAIGYDKIEAKLPELGLVSKMDEQFNKIMLVRDRLLSLGYSEIMTYTFQDNGEIEVLASASDKKFLRNISGLLNSFGQSLEKNKLNSPLLNLKEIKIFEIGTVFSQKGEEIYVVWNEKNEIKFLLLDKAIEHFKISSNILPEEKKFNYNQSFKMWSLFPFISRDVAVWMPEGENSEELKKILIENGTELLIKEPYLFDSFTKDGKISYAFRLVFQSYDRTLTDEEVNKIMDKINQKISEKKDWQAR